ncbi:MAG: hypothetical protein ACYDA8_03720 [Deferrisomatales bacterium]
MLNTVRKLASRLPELAKAVAGEQDGRWGPAAIRAQIVASIEARAPSLLGRLEP